MSTVEEIERAIARLDRADVSRLRVWLDEFEESQFDARIEADAEAGRLDGLADRAVQQIGERRVRDL
jgi:hypothetical protein